MIHQIFAEEVHKKLGFEAFISISKQSFDTIEFDSRDITHPEKTLFLCLKGQKSDGHAYIKSLIDLGVKSFLISDASYVNNQANFFLCEDTVVGFQALAQEIRKSFTKNNVIAITGSNGKTIVKEWLGQILSVRWNICKSPKSFNSQIGVPYSVSKLSNHDGAIFETGISQKGEMQALAETIQPNIVIFTNIGDAHSEGFENITQKIEEKALLGAEASSIIYCKEHTQIATILEQKYPKDKLISWGEDADFKVAYKTEDQKTIVKINEHTFQTLLVDKASLENATHCIVTSLVLGLDPKVIQFGLSLLKAVDMRFELKEGADNNMLLNDSYNNDLAGLKMTLDLAKKLNRNAKMVLLFSEFVHQDLIDETRDRELLFLLQNSNLEHVYWVGKSNAVTDKVTNCTCFAETKELAVFLQKNKLKDTFFVIKGARQFEFEQLVDVLELKQHITRVEVNLSSLIQNYNYYKSLLKPQTKIMVMVKAFAYGTGIVEVSKLLEMNQVDYLAVAYADEGVLLRQNGITKPIMVMNVVSDDLEHLLEYKLEPEIFSLEQLTYFTQKTTDLSYHLKLDTGMHRLGFDDDNLETLLQFLEQNPTLKVLSILSHLAATDEAQHDEYTYLQLQKFESYSQAIQKALGYKVNRHILNSAGIERFTDYQYDMVRLGIGVYGFGVKEAKSLKQVISLKTHISQTRKLVATETVGYGRKGKLTRDSIIATIPIGYADGYDRRFSNGVGSVLIHGKEAKVIGNVCMDMTMIDVTDIDCKAGDEVIVYNEVLSADSQAKKIGTISYELLTHLSERVRRIFYFD